MVRSTAPSSRCRRDRMRSSSGLSTAASTLVPRPAAWHPRRRARRSGSKRAWKRSTSSRAARGWAASAASTLACAKPKPTCFSQRNMARSSQHSRQSSPARSTSRLKPSASARPSSSAASASSSGGEAVLGHRRRRHQGEDVQHRRRGAGRGQPVRHLLDRPQVQALEQRQGIGQRQRPAGIGQPQHQPGSAPGGRAQRGRRPALGQGAARPGRGRRRPRRRSRPRGRRRGRRRASGPGRRPPRPRRARRASASASRSWKPRAAWATAASSAARPATWSRPRRVGADDVVDARQRRVAERDVQGATAARRRPAPASPPTLLAQPGVEGVARQPGDGRDEAAERVAPQHQRRARADLQVERAPRRRQDLGLLRLEQLVARPGVEDVAQRPAVMRFRVVAGGGEDAVHLLRQQRDAARVAVVGAGGEQAEEQAHPGHPPVRPRIRVATTSACCGRCTVLRMFALATRDRRRRRAGRRAAAAAGS